MSANKAFKANRRALTRGLSLPTSFAVVGLLCAASQTVSQHVCAAMCDSGAGPIIYRIGGDVSQPAVLHRVEPTYPEEARVASISGSVAVRVEVRPDGIAHNIRVTRGLAPTLDQSAIDAIRQWRFQPATRNGQPVTVEAIIELTFGLP